MNRVNSMGGVVLQLNLKSRSMFSTSRVRLRVFARRAWRSLVAAWVVLDEKWREQAVRAAEMERIRLREQVRMHERLPMTRWHGHY